MRWCIIGVIDRHIHRHGCMILLALLIGVLTIRLPIEAARSAKPPAAKPPASPIFSEEEKFAITVIIAAARRFQTPDQPLMIWGDPQQTTGMMSPCFVYGKRVGNMSAQVWLCYAPPIKHPHRLDSAALVLEDARAFMAAVQDWLGEPRARKVIGKDEEWYYDAPNLGISSVKFSPGLISTHSLAIFFR